MKKYMTTIKVKFCDVVSEELCLDQERALYMVFKRKIEKSESLIRVSEILKKGKYHSFSFEEGQVNKVEVWDYQSLNAVFKGSLLNLKTHFHQKYKLPKFQIRLTLKVDISSSQSLREQKDHDVSPILKLKRDQISTEESLSALFECEKMLMKIPKGKAFQSIDMASFFY